MDDFMIMDDSENEGSSIECEVHDIQKSLGISHKHTSMPWDYSSSESDDNME